MRFDRNLSYQRKIITTTGYCTNLRKELILSDVEESERERESEKSDENNEREISIISIRATYCCVFY